MKIKKCIKTGKRDGIMGEKNVDVKNVLSLNRVGMA